MMYLYIHTHMYRNKEIYIYIFIFVCVYTPQKISISPPLNVAWNRWGISHWGAAWNQIRPFGAHIGDTRRSSFTFGEFGAPYFFITNLCVRILERLTELTDPCYGEWYMSKHHINFIISTSNGFEGIFELCCGLSGPTIFRFNTLKILISVVVSIYHISPLQVVLQNFRPRAEIFDPPLVCLEGIDAATVFGVALCISLFCCDDLWDWKVRTLSLVCYMFESASCAIFVCMSPSHEQDSSAEGGNWTFVVFAYGLIIHQSFQNLILTTSKTSSMSLHTDMFWVISPQYSYSPYPQSVIVLRYSDLQVLILNRLFFFQDTDQEGTSL